MERYLREMIGNYLTLNSPSPRGVQILDISKKFRFSKLIWCTGPKKQLLCKKIRKFYLLAIAHGG